MALVVVVEQGCEKAVHILGTRVGKLCKCGKKAMFIWRRCPIKSAFSDSFSRLPIQGNISTKWIRSHYGMYCTISYSQPTQILLDKEVSLHVANINNANLLHIAVGKEENVQDCDRNDLEYRGQWNDIPLSAASKLGKKNSVKVLKRHLEQI